MDSVGALRGICMQTNAADHHKLCSVAGNKLGNLSCLSNTELVSKEKVNKQKKTILLYVPSLDQTLVTKFPRQGPGLACYR